MIISKIGGGLGNQLFQYSLGRQLSILNDTEYKIDISDYAGSKADPKLGVRVCGLGNFNIQASPANDRDLGGFKYLTDNKIFRRFLRLYSRPTTYFKRRYILEPEKNAFRFDPNVLGIRTSRKIYLEGYWVAEKYFQNISNVIKDDLTFKQEPDEVNQEMIRRIAAGNSVSIHIRHGDNVLIEGGKAVLPASYYSTAVRKIADRIADPVFYIFSDDPDWARDNIKLNYQAVYVSHNGDEKNYEDLRLMTNCKHNIIGNSTFSWWGAWLGKKDGQIVIAPKCHLDKDVSDLDYYPAGWEIL